MTGDEDVAAAAERARRWVDVAAWTAIALGLAFTAVNVQQFAAGGAVAWSPGWVVAWLLDPMVSVLLLAVVRAEQVTARWQVPMPWQVVAVKWCAFAATYCMNTWSAWRDGVPSSVVLHSVPPVFVLLAAEVAPALRDRLTAAVQAAAAEEQALEELPAAAAPAAPLASTSLAASDLAGEGPATAAVPPELTRPPQESPRDDEGAEPAVGTDPRVRQIAELLAAGCDVTGAQAAAVHGVSERTGRRLLADARAGLQHHPPVTRPDLHLVEAHTSGGTA